LVPKKRVKEFWKETWDCSHSVSTTLVHVSPGIELVDRYYLNEDELDERLAGHGI
jgi:hypothetical protein